MAGDKTLMERIRGKRTRDIELESEGTVDPRLSRYDTGKSIAKAAKNFKALQKRGILGGKR